MNKSTDFQTPPPVADYMAAMLPNFFSCTFTCLEPTPGQGNLIDAVKRRFDGKATPSFTAPKDFWKLKSGPDYNCAIMNPPFTPMPEAYRFLYAVMDMTCHIVALMPWQTLINSEKRLKLIRTYGLQSVTSLPASVFPGSRIRACVMQMTWGYKKETVFKHFEFNKS